MLHVTSPQLKGILVTLILVVFSLSGGRVHAAGSLPVFFEEVVALQDESVYSTENAESFDHLLGTKFFEQLFGGYSQSISSETRQALIKDLKNKFPQIFELHKLENRSSKQLWKNLESYLERSGETLAQDMASENKINKGFGWEKMAIRDIRAKIAQSLSHNGENLDSTGILEKKIVELFHDNLFEKLGSSASIQDFIKSVLSKSLINSKDRWFDIRVQVPNLEQDTFTLGVRTGWTPLGMKVLSSGNADLLEGDTILTIKNRRGIFDYRKFLFDKDSTDALRYFVMDGTFSEDFVIEVLRDGKFQTIETKSKMLKTFLAENDFGVEQELVDETAFAVPSVWIDADVFQSPFILGKVKLILQNMSEQGQKKVILDLRDSPGGKIKHAMHLLSLFIPGEEDVLSYNDEDSASVPKGTAYFDPKDVVILISRTTASAAEIFSGIMQEYGAVLVGTQSYGKGYYQFNSSHLTSHFWKLPREKGMPSTVTYTVGEYLLGKNKSRIGGVGLNPNVKLGEKSDTISEQAWINAVNPLVHELHSCEAVFIEQKKSPVPKASRE